MEGAVVGVRHKVNEKFYGKTVTAREILIEKKVTAPDDKETMLPDVMEKLNKLEAAASEPVDITPAAAPAEEEKKDTAEEGEKKEEADAPKEDSK